MSIVLLLDALSAVFSSDSSGSSASSINSGSTFSADDCAPD